MKPARYFIHFLLPILLWACSGNASSNPALLHAARLLDENPDSAAVALQTLDTINVETLTEFDRNYHTLLTVKAHDKLYMPHNGDSAINSVADYFPESSELYPEILFYQGRVSADNGDYPSALQYFDKAAGLADNNTAHIPLKGKAYWQMAHISSALGLDSESIRYAGMAEDCFQEIGDIASVAYCEKIKGNAHLNSGAFPEAIKSFEMAITIMKMARPDNVPHLIIYLAAAQLQNGEKVKALSSIRSLRDFSDLRVNNNYYLHAAKIYAANGMPDSAAIFLRKLIESPDGLNRHVGYRMLLSEPLRKNIPSDSLYWFMEKFYESFCAHIDRYDSQTAGLISSTLNYDSHKKAREEAEKGRRRLSQVLGLLLMAIMAGATVVLVIHNRRNRRLVSLLETNDMLRRLLDESKHNEPDESKTAGDSRTARLPDSERSIRMEEELKGRIRDLAEIKGKAGMVDERIVSSGFYRELTDVISRKCSVPADSPFWTRLEATVLMATPGFLNKLHVIVRGLTVAETRMCLLNRCGVTPSQSAIIFSLSKQGLNSRRSRLRKKIGTGTISPDDLDVIIRNL